MDIRKHAVEETSVIHLRDAADQPLFETVGDEAVPVEIVVYGPGSKQFAKAQAAQNARVTERIRRKGKFVAPSAADTAEETATFLSTITKEFRHIEVDDLRGEALFKSVYSDSSLGFIADQVRQHIGEWSNFTKSAPTA